MYANLFISIKRQDSAEIDTLDPCYRTQNFLLARSSVRYGPVTLHKTKYVRCLAHMCPLKLQLWGNSCLHNSQLTLLVTKLALQQWGQGLHEEIGTGLKLGFREKDALVVINSAILSQKHINVEPVLVD